MSEARIKFDYLQSRIDAKEAELRDLQAQLKELKESTESAPPSAISQHAAHPEPETLQLDEFKRYGRQMILPEIGLPSTVVGLLPARGARYTDLITRSAEAEKHRCACSRARRAGMPGSSVSGRRRRWHPRAR